MTTATLLIRPAIFVGKELWQIFDSEQEAIERAKLIISTDAVRVINVRVSFDLYRTAPAYIRHGDNI